MSNIDSTNELSLRVKTGFIVAAGIGALVYTPVFVVGIFVLFLAFIGSLEFTKMLSNKKNEELVKLPEFLLPGSAVIMSIGVFAGEFWLHTTFVISAFSWALYQLIFLKKNKLSNFKSIWFGLFGMSWVIWSILHVTLIKSLPDGSNFLFLLILVISFSDVAAYFGGKRFGKSLLAPKISPKKTWEGSFFGIIGGGIVGAVFGEHFLTMFWFKGLVISIMVSIIGQFSDLVESKIKRICNVKDSGTLLPGHGGVLDRIDGYLLAAPVFYYFLKL